MYVEDVGDVKNKYGNDMDLRIDLTNEQINGCQYELAKIQMTFVYSGSC